MTEVRASGLAVLTANAFLSSSSEAELPSLGTPSVHRAGLSGASGRVTKPSEAGVVTHFNPRKLELSDVLQAPQLPGGICPLSPFSIFLFKCMPVSTNG